MMAENSRLQFWIVAEYADCDNADSWLTTVISVATLMAFTKDSLG